MEETPASHNFFSVIKKIILIIRILPLFEKAIFFALISVFAISLFGIIFKINNIYSVNVPDFGGEINEGIMGSPRFINPLLSVSDADRDLVKLIYSGLLEPDGRGNLIPSLAKNYEISDNGLEYTFYLNNKAKWHDGVPVKSDDIVFTVKRAKNPGLNSFQRASWEGVEAEKIDDYTIKFYLKKPYAPFLENASLPIIPKHIWEDTLPEEMGLSNFNIEPVGSGPYKIKKVFRNSAGLITSIKLAADKDFVLGKPYIKYFNVYFFSSEEKLINSFKQGKINATGFISQTSINSVINKDISLKKLTLPRVFGLFFNSSNNPILENKEIKEALEVSLDRNFIINEVLKGHGVSVNSPIPPGSLGAKSFNDVYDNLGREERISAAKQILENSGWKMNGGVYEKIINNKAVKLALNISTSNSGGFDKAGEIIKDTWEKTGIKTNLKIFEIGDLNQSVIRKRNYEVLLFGEVYGRDPDPFAFWHSSQRNVPGLNIALYANNSVDRILEEARAETNIEKRIEKYRNFQDKIKEDRAAIFLYSPYFIYLMPNFVKGFENENISFPQERFSQLHKWHIYEAKVLPLFLK